MVQGRFAMRIIFHCWWLQKSMASGFIDQKRADKGESRDVDFEAIGARSAVLVPAATELFRPDWSPFSLLMERHQSRLQNRLLAEMYQAARIALVILLAIVRLIPMQSLLNRRPAAATDFLGSKFLVLALCLKCWQIMQLSEFELDVLWVNFMQ